MKRASALGRRWIIFTFAAMDGMLLQKAYSGCFATGLYQRMTSVVPIRLEHFLFYCRPLMECLIQAWALSVVMSGSASVMA